MKNQTNALVYINLEVNRPCPEGGPDWRSFSEHRPVAAVAVVQPGAGVEEGVVEQAVLRHTAAGADQVVHALLQRTEITIDNTDCINVSYPIS
jgi:hypothetical protein